jgi:nitrogen fixation NifU-like protein
MSLDRLLEHCEQPYHRGPAPRATHAHEQTNPACGDVVRIELLIEDGVIQHAYFTGVGCRISQAAASMLVEHIEGRAVDHIKHFSAADMLALFGPPLTPLRQRCGLLAWQTLQQAIYSAIPIST